MLLSINSLKNSESWLQGNSSINMYARIDVNLIKTPRMHALKCYPLLKKHEPSHVPALKCIIAGNIQ